MGTARPPQQDPRDWEIPAQGPLQRAEGPAPSAATLRALILALLWRGSLSQEPGYSLWVPQAVSVQEGLCVRLPCTFRYPEKYDRESPGSQLYRHWYKGEAQVGSDPPVASSDPRRVVSQETRGRFRLVVDPALGDCSLQISDARRTDEGSYFLRVERGEFRCSYRSTTHTPYYPRGYTEPRLSVLGLTEQPEIQTSPARGLPGELLAGEPVTVTCTAPGRCSGTPPRVTWTGPFNDTARDVSARLENGSWAYSSALSFTPTAGDHSQNLTCTVTYGSAGRPATSRTIRILICWDPPPGPPAHSGELRNLRAVGRVMGEAGPVPSLLPGAGSGALGSGEEMDSTGGGTRTLIEISCKSVFMGTGFFLAYYLTRLYYRGTRCCCGGSRRKDRPGVRDSAVQESGGWLKGFAIAPVASQVQLRLAGLFCQAQPAPRFRGLGQPHAPAMGTARSLQQDPRDWEIPAQGPPQRAGGPAPSAATLRALILALLWRGSLSQEPGYSLWVPQAVSVQEGLCVRLPCTFQYPEKYDRENPGSQLYRHWYKGEAQVGSDPPVASSDPRRVVSQETRGRFRLVVDPALGNCSLQISDARRTDEGSYFLRVQRAEFRYSYRSTTRPPYYSFGYTEPRLSLEIPGLTEQPEIQTSPVRGLPGELLAGEPVTVTCTAPGRCSGTPPRVTWTGPFNDTARDVSARLENGSWAYSSALSFTPTAGDHGQNLTCTVTYSSAGRPATSRTIRLRIAYAGGSGKLLGAGVACGVGVALGFFLLGLWVIRRRGRGPEPPSAETGQMANGSQGQHTADIPSLIYCNVTPLPVEHKPPATRQSRGVQGAPLSPGEPEELHYAAIDLTKLQHPEGEPPPAPKSEYSEIWRK
ncbi:uncharacterized protein LOC142004058 [Carettochelys insculpta]|uniref:uncharacterized protein LOC142004058 n=1 Tax=Carettochelys insculpta TaxID=44489 RepID=UPI003EBF094C